MSRYLSLNQYNRNGKKVYFTAPSVTPDFYNTISSTLYVTNQKDRLDQIAGQFYDGRGDLWWIIAEANGLTLPTDITPGMMLRIPLDYQTVLAARSHLNNQ